MEEKETFKTRLAKEEVDLYNKMIKLDTFRRSDKFKELDIVQQELLHIQFSAMGTYLNCLSARMETLEKVEG